MTTDCGPALAGGEIRHLLLTRVNVSRGFGHSDGRAVSAPWLDRQLELFEGLALPSVRSQSNQDFTWMLLASEDTPEPYRARLLSYENHNTLVHFIGDYSAELPGRLAHSHLGPCACRLVTSRVDTDDVLHIDYLAGVRRAATNASHGFLNWDRGYVYDLSRARLYATTHRSNMFINLVESVAAGATPLTAMGVIHTRAADMFPVAAIDSPPRWIQVIHDQNWMSAMARHRPAPSAGLAGFHAPLLDGGRNRPIVAEFADQSRWRIARVVVGARRVLQRTLQRRWTP